jgi:hypothetical protein
MERGFKDKERRKNEEKKLSGEESWKEMKMKGEKFQRKILGWEGERENERKERDGSLPLRLYWSPRRSIVQTA